MEHFSNVDIDSNTVSDNDTNTNTDSDKQDKNIKVSITVRVRYFETDQMQVAHHAHYLVWFEQARSEFCRVRGIDYTQMEQQGYFLPIVEAYCRYIAPARYDEEIVVTTHVVAAKRRTLRMGYRVTRGDTLLAEGTTYQIVVGLDKKPRTLPPSLYAIFSTESTQENEPG